MKRLTNWINKHNEDGGLYFGVLIGAMAWIVFFAVSWIFTYVFK